MYQWRTPQEWLRWKVKERDMGVEELLLLALKLDGDTIEDAYAVEMVKDGYYTDLQPCECPEHDAIMRREDNLVNKCDLLGCDLLRLCCCNCREACEAYEDETDNDYPCSNRDLQEV